MPRGVLTILTFVSLSLMVLVVNCIEAGASYGLTSWAFWAVFAIMGLLGVTAYNKGKIDAKDVE